MINALVITNMYPYDKFPFYGMVVKEEVDCLRQKDVKTEVLFINGRENRWNYLKGMFKLLRLLSSQRFDIVHTHHSYCAYMAIIARLCLKLKVPLLLTLHEGEICHNGKVSYKIDFIEKIKYMRFFKNYVINRLDRLITVYEGLLRAPLKTAYSTVPCGVNIDLFRPLAQADCRRRLKINENARVIFFPSDYRRPEKRFDLVKKAYTILKAHYGNGLILLQGGAINYDLMPVYLNAGNVMVLSSDYEASPMVIKEAMATNTPIVSVDVGDVKDVINGIKGCYIARQQPWDIAQKLKYALEFNQRTTGREKLKELRLSLEQSSARIGEIYERLVSRNELVYAEKPLAGVG